MNDDASVRAWVSGYLIGLVARFKSENGLNVTEATPESFVVIVRMTSGDHQRVRVTVTEADAP